MTDRISALLGAPPHHWKKNETQQIKQIHRCFRTAYKVLQQNDVELQDDTDVKVTIELGGGRVLKQHGRVDNRDNDWDDGRTSKKKGYDDDDKVDTGREARDRDRDLDDEEEYKKDEEDYLPKNSVLRSKNGDKKAPLNPCFKDYDAFVLSCAYDYWREEFDAQPKDHFLSEIASAIVSAICTSQSRAVLRVKNGHIPLRKKREQITPLALTLHELKTWSTHQLRNADPFDEGTYKDIACRIKYLDLLKEKEVWGDVAMAFGAGMRAGAFDNLFRLIMSAKQNLQKAHDHAYRRYSQRTSREKLLQAGELVKSVIFRSMKMMSFIMTVDKKLIDPKTSRLQPTDMLNSMQNHGFIDYRNIANVLLYRLFQHPLVRASFTTEFDNEDVQNAIADLVSWASSNFFCVPVEGSEEPHFLFDTKREYRILPEIYRPTAQSLSSALKKVDPKAVVPLSAKKHVSILSKAYEGEDAAGEVMRLVMMNLAAVQNLIPTIFTLHQLWSLAGDGGDRTVYDTLREEVIETMDTTVRRLKILEDSEKHLLKEISRLCAVKEKAMEERQLRDKKARFKPAWVTNYKFIRAEILPATQMAYDKAVKQMMEITGDALEYSLTSDQVDDKVKMVKNVIEALTGKEFKKPEPAKEKPVSVNKRKPRAHSKESRDMYDWDDREEFGANNLFGDAKYSVAESAITKFNPFEGADDSDEGF